MEKRRSKWTGRCARLPIKYWCALPRPVMRHIPYHEYPFRDVVYNKLEFGITFRLRTLYAARPRMGWQYSIKLPG